MIHYSWNSHIEGVGHWPPLIGNCFARIPLSRSIPQTCRVKGRRGRTRSGARSQASLLLVVDDEIVYCSALRIGTCLCQGSSLSVR